MATHSQIRCTRSSNVSRLRRTQPGSSLIAAVFLNFRIVLALSLALCQSLFLSPLNYASERLETEPIFKETNALLAEYFPKIKLSISKDKMHFEYKAHTLVNNYTNREELAPDVGGVIGDIAIEQGPYAGSQSVPKQENEYYYWTVTLAPYSQQSNRHLKAVLKYASDTPADFVQRFKDRINAFADIAKPTGPVSGEPTETPGISLEKKAGPSTSESTLPISSSGTCVTSAPVLAPRLFLWKAVRGKEIVYLLGTIHVATDSFYPLPAEIDDAFDQSKKLVVEVAIDKRQSDIGKVEQQVEKTSSTYTPPDHLSKHLSADTRKAFDSYLSWAGESWTMYEQYKPWYVATILEASLPRRGEILKIKPGLGIDRYLLARAKLEDKSVAELETIESQLSLRSKLAEDVQDKLLLQTVFDFQTSIQTINELLEAWKSGDPDKMSEITNRSFTEHPGLAQYQSMLLNQRNLKMAEKIDELAKTSPGPIFVAVGSAHLIGETGLVNSLKKRGFALEQISRESQSPAQSTTPTATEKFSYFRQRFKIWMPVRPTESVSGVQPQITTYLADDPTAKGTNLVLYLALPTDQSALNIPGPLFLDIALNAVIKDSGTAVSDRHTRFIQSCCCRQVDFSLKDSDPLSLPNATGKKAVIDPGAPEVILQEATRRLHIGKPLVHVDGYLYDRHIYILLACGTKQWLHSTDAQKFIDSIEFIH